MATIINALEVVVEEPAAPAPAPARAVTGHPTAPSAQLSPTDVADLVERRGRYHARLLAH